MIDDAHSSLNIARTAIVMPVVDSVPGFADLVATVRGIGFKVVVVDDGSALVEGKVWERVGLAATVLHHVRNEGKGAALKTAFAHIAGSMDGVGYVVTMDGDGQHLIGDVLRVARAVWEKPDALVLGTRRPHTGAPLRSRIGNAVARRLFKSATGMDLSDTQTGLRACGIALLPLMAAIDGSGYEYETNVLLRCCSQEVPMFQIEVEGLYADQRNSSSHFNPIADSFAILARILLFAGASLVGFAVDCLLFVLVTAILPSGPAFLVVANIVARSGSATANYKINARAAFRGRAQGAVGVLRYAAIALTILAANSLLLVAAVDTGGLDPLLAKVLVDVSLFAASYAAQSRFVFPRSDARREEVAAHGFLAGRAV